MSAPRRNLFFSVLLFVVSHLLTLYTYSLHWEPRIRLPLYASLSLAYFFISIFIQQWTRSSHYTTLLYIVSVSDIPWNMIIVLNKITSGKIFSMMVYQTEHSNCSMLWATEINSIKQDVLYLFYIPVFFLSFIDDRGKFITHDILYLLLNHAVIVVKPCCVEGLMEDRCISNKHSRK